MTIIVNNPTVADLISALQRLDPDAIWRGKADGDIETKDYRGRSIVISPK